MDALRDDLIGQFGVVEEMIRLAIRSLVRREVGLSRQVIDRDKQVDATEIAIEEECLKLIALHQPVAADMRWLIAVVKVNAELERMADLACNIAERAQALGRFPLFPVPDEVTDMVGAATSMVRKALDAFVDNNSADATEVLASDDEVDALNRIVIDQLHELMKDDPQQIEPAVHCFSASRHLERIADLASNIAEDVIYLVDGEIVRHQHMLREPKPAASDAG